MFKKLMILPFLLGLAACSSDGGGSSSSSTTYSISGTLDTGATTSSVGYALESMGFEQMDFQLRSRTQCTDGQFYSVFCMTFESPPTAAEGDVDCTNGGAFTVEGLPLNEPIYCVVRRYESASATTGSSIGAIEIPATNLNGATDTIVGAGNLEMSVSLGDDGAITATVTGDQGDTSNSTVDSFFTAANVNGEWALACDSDSGGTLFSAGACKCFLGQASYGAAGYSNQDDCMNDPNGAGAAITGSVSLGIGMYVYDVTTNSDIPMDGGNTLPSGTDMKAISIWGTSGSPGSYTSLKAGGEGISDLGGALTWSTSPLDPTQSITWTSGNVNVEDGNSASVTINVPALSNPNSMTHGQWITWLQSVASAAETGGFDCTWGPGDANAHSANAGTGLNMNLECINQIIEALTMDGVAAVIPRVRIQPFCDQNGCLLSSDTTGDSGSGYESSSTFSNARLEFEDWHLSYPNEWNSGDNNDSVANSNNEGIGVGPQARYVFEPLDIHPAGAGFRQGHHNEDHFECVSSGAASNQVANSACSNGSNYYELVCYSVEELAIKFLGSSSPMDVIFESTENVAFAQLYEHGTQKGPINPTGTTAMDMCLTAKGDGGNFTFFATGTKQ